MRTKIFKFFVLFLAVLCSGEVSSQETIFLGKVVDKKTNEPIPGVYLMLHGNPVSFTDDKGVFELSCDPSKDKELVFSHITFETDSIPITKLRADTSKIKLKEKYIGLNEVTIVSDRFRSLIKRVHKHFVKTYRPFCYWAQSDFKQSISFQGEPCGYIECVGYTFMPVPDPMVWRGVFSIVPQELRRTPENPIVLNAVNKRLKSIYFQLGPSKIYRNLGEFGFFERLHPLARFDFNNYEFKFDSIESNNNEDYVFYFKQTKKMITVGGWPLMGSTGKIWIDRESLDIRKITSTFYRTIRAVQTEVSYITIDGITYPKKIKMNILHNLKDAKKSINKLYSEVEIDFLKIDSTPRHNYSRGKYKLEYNVATIIADYDYHPLFWNQYPAKGKWGKFIKEVTHGNENNEFSLGAKEPIFRKDGPYYKEHTGILKESSLKFVEQMKKDLNLKEQ